MTESRVAIVLFTRDLRVHDNSALAAAAREAKVVPLFVFDDLILRSPLVGPNRIRFLHESLEQLAAGLESLGGALVVRRGPTVATVVEVARDVGAVSVHAMLDVSATALQRQAALGEACHALGIRLRLHPGVTVVPPDEPRTTSGGGYRIFTPFWRAWSALPRRPLEAPPALVAIPQGLARGVLPRLEELSSGPFSPEVLRGGEREGRARLDRVLSDVIPSYGDERHELRSGTTRLSAHLHFGCLSPLEVERRASKLEGTEPFVRQLAWRDFHHHTTLGFPAIASCDLRPRGRARHADEAELRAWCDGLTGYPIVDAGMRQLLVEGWLPGRARMIVATFLTKHLGHDWREGAAHFARWLVDGDVANNSANWQWVAGTGTDTRPGRILNPLRQARRFDPDGAYVRRYVPELADLDESVIHTPWMLGTARRATLEYPDRLVDHELAANRFRSRMLVA